MKYILLLFISYLFVYAEPISPLPLHVSIDKEKSALGKSLFFDTLLSTDNTISCASCHNLDNGGDDGLKFSFGIEGLEGDINAPSVYNSVYNFRQFWNGRAKDLHEQAKGPIENPIEMGNNFKNLIATLENSSYKERFEALYSEGITEESIADAIVEYEKTLTTPNAPFDRYLRGDTLAISEDAKEGYEIFKSKGCIACHHGMNVGGNLYNKFGVLKEAKSKRQGRYEVTGNEKDKYYFKVPSLRNVEHTAPYLHDGRFEHLEDVVKFMAHYQLGRVISESEVKKVVVFLHSLSGEIPLSAKQANQ